MLNRGPAALALAVCLLATSFTAARAMPPTAAEVGDTHQQVLLMLRMPADHVRPNSAYGGSYGDAAARSGSRRIAAHLARVHGLKLLDDWPMPLIGVDCFVLLAPPGVSPSEIAAVLSREPAVAWAQPVNLYRGSGEPAHDDPLFRTQPAARQWRLAWLHQTTIGKAVRVAVIDTYVEASHPDLAGQIEVAKDFASDHPRAAEQHGTNVAGIIAARADNGIGIAGVAPGARLLALRACWQETAGSQASVCDTLSLARALDYAITHQVSVINLSLSGPPDPLLANLLDAAQTRRITVVAAYDRQLPSGGFPASHAGVTAVADQSWTGLPAGVYTAPGDDVPTTTAGGHWGLVSGSSFAAAHVSGLFALLRGRAKRSAGPFSLVAARGGAVDACATVLGSSRACDCGCAQASRTPPTVGR